MSRVDELEDQVRRLTRRLEAVAVLDELVAGAGLATGRPEILARVAAALPRVVPCDTAAVLVDVGPDEALVHLHALAPCDDRTLTRVRDQVLALHAAGTGRAPRAEDELVVHVTGARRAEVAPGLEPSSAHAPIGTAGAPAGLLLVESAAHAFDDEDAALLALAGARTAAALEQLTVRIASERAKLALMVESMADGVIMTDEKTEVIAINSAARHMLGLDADVTVTANFLKEKLGFYPFDLVARAQPAREDLTVGTRKMHSIVSPVVDAAGQRLGVIVVLRDLSEWHELERRKEELVTVISHELRTPLASLAGALDLAGKTAAEGPAPKQLAYLGIARDACARLHTIVDELLEAARLEHGGPPMELRPLALDRLAEECVTRFRSAARDKHIALHFKNDVGAGGEPGQGEIRIVGDADRLGQVLGNLLSNAIRFTPEGGRVEVETFGPSVASSHVGLSVWNNGAAIPEEEREHVFDRFELTGRATGRRVGGTALGLAMSRSIVEGHGGTIWVESAPFGTKFVLTLPAAPAERVARPAELAPGDRPAPEAGPTGRQVLVVDGDRYAAYLWKGALMGAGHRVHVAHDADEALAWARDHLPDLVTTDEQLPGVDGLALVEILKHDPATRKAAVVVVSARPCRDAALRAGADAFFQKPVDVDRFREACTRLLVERLRKSALKVLVVDDDPDIRLICRDVLETEGYVVREAADGKAALAEAERFRPDLMLLDIMMPELDGFQTAERFREGLPGRLVPVIFVSARGRTADKVRAFKLGAEDYLVKPFDTSELVARVGKALERREREIDASPTTQLPGAGAIEAEIDRRVSEGGDFAFCYVDLDNLKAFNDHYGIAKADAVIRQTGDLMRGALAREGTTGDFIGHIAGDDFVFITTPERVDRIGRSICAAFDRLIPLYYDRADRERGYIEAHDRYGQLRRFPILSVSIAALTTRRDRPAFHSYADLGAAAAEAKKQAKAVPGTSYVRDGVVVVPGES